ncbi:hypothetical protein CPAR01_02755 [Colletotrichum paranaense]|uniref:Uncharacterized protein n=1 Tax=Colletotrichum paranaense TaxID=1914294 RepID=A0ABQ9T0G2_9PEZI|nr:uncharacterized protein CPAR01_02755 [Colletotrichum paranaense]KAK1545253.1 hypothetical protein CPAR01_02755 [Colletotrichum paranaense]
MPCHLASLLSSPQQVTLPFIVPVDLGLWRRSKGEWYAVDVSISHISNGRPPPKPLLRIGVIRSGQHGEGPFRPPWECANASAAAAAAAAADARLSLQLRAQPTASIPPPSLPARVPFLQGKTLLSADQSRAACDPIIDPTILVSVPFRKDSQTHINLEWDSPLIPTRTAYCVEEVMAGYGSPDEDLPRASGEKISLAPSPA